MNRRKFVRNTALSSALLTLPSSLLAQDETQKLTILHTNDQHSRIEPFEKSSNPRFSDKGGFARRASLIESIGQQEENVLLVDAGDIWQGTPYFNFFGGELEFKLMSKMKYDFSTLGNHDFDAGLNGFLKQLPNASFEFVNANYDFSNTILEGKIQPYKVFHKGDIKIGIFGLGIELAGLVPKKDYLETKYLDPVETAQEITAKLKALKCDLIICLSHLGFEYEDTENKISDMTFAQKTQDIDIIIGGHTHTFLDEPVIQINKAGKEVIINQVGWAGLFLGRIDVYLSKFKNKKQYVFHNISVENNFVLKS